MIIQESALALALINIAITDSHYGKQCVRIKCDGDTSQEAADLLQDQQIIQNPLSALYVKTKRQWKRGQENPNCTSTHLQQGAKPRPAENGVLEMTVLANESMVRSREGR